MPINSTACISIPHETLADCIAESLCKAQDLGIPITVTYKKGSMHGGFECHIPGVKEAGLSGWEAPAQMRRNRTALFDLFNENFYEDIWSEDNRAAGPLARVARITSTSQENPSKATSFNIDFVPNKDWLGDVRRHCTDPEYFSRSGESHSVRLESVTDETLTRSEIRLLGDLCITELQGSKEVTTSQYWVKVPFMARVTFDPPLGQMLTSQPNVTQDSIRAHNDSQETLVPREETLVPGKDIA